MNEEDTLKLVQNLDPNDITEEIAYILAQNLGEKIMNVSFENALPLVNEVSVEYFNKVDPLKLAENIDKLNLDDMDDNRKIYITKLVII